MANDTQWTSLSLSAALVPLEDIAQGISTTTSVLGTIINLHKTALEIISTLLLDFLNAQDLLIQTALEALQALIDQYVVGDAKVHLLAIPIRKDPQYRLAADYDMPQAEDSWSFSDAIPVGVRKQFENALYRIAHYDQGNEGFARTLIDATYDENDPNRPQYDADDAVFGAIFMAGGSDLLGAYQLLRLLQSIFNVALKGNPLVPDTIAKPAQDLKATPIAAPGTTRIGVRLNWTNPPAIQTLADFGGARLKLREIAIIRSTNDETVRARNWNELFGQTQPAALTDEETERVDALSTADGWTKVIHIYKFNGVRNVFIDDDETLTKDVDYYYTLSYRYELSGNPTDRGAVTYIEQNYDQLSNVVKVRLSDELPSTRGGVKPDWNATPNVLDLVPDLKFFLRLIQNYIESLKSQTQGAAGALQSYIEFLTAEAQRYTDFAAEINNRLARLKSLLQLPETGLYATTISHDTGGMPAFLQTALQRLTDESDTSAPPFFKHGVTAGVVLIAGAPNPAALAPVQTLLSLLFGNTSVTTPFENALNSIDRLVTSVEQTTFTDNMQPT